MSQVTHPKYDRIADLKRLTFIVNSLEKYVPAGGRIQDIGCGNGIISIEVGKRGYQVLGIDSSEEAINKATASCDLDNVKFQIFNAEETIDSNTKFDAVICSEVLEHLHQPGKLLQQLYTSLKDDGILIVTVPNGMGPREVLVTKPVQKIMKEGGRNSRWLMKAKSVLGYSGKTPQSAASDLNHIQFFTKSKLEKLAQLNGFQIVNFRKSNFIDDVFPFSLVTKRSKMLQKLDSLAADSLPHIFAGGFLSVWKKL